MLPAIASGLHILGILVGGTAFVVRSQHLRGPLDDAGVKRLLTWDNISGVAALVFVSSGLWRAFGGLEKPAEFYLGSWLFVGKMGLFFLLITLECVPMVTFIKWRFQLAKGLKPDLSRLPLLERIDRMELLIFPCIVLLAPFMARGYGQMSTAELPAEVAIAGAPADPAKGRATYETLCAPCHGPNGHGKPGLGSASFHDERVHGKSDEALLQAIVQGVPGTAMPAWGEQLDPSQRGDVLAFIRTRFGPPRE